MTGQTNDNPAGGPPRQDEPKDKQKAARSLRRSLAVRLISASLLATLLLGGIVFYETSSLLTTAVETQLGSQQGSQARAISTGLSSIKGTVSIMARDQELVRALSDLAAAFEELDQQSDLLEPAEVESLDKLYRDMVAEAAARTGFDLPPGEELVPAGEAGRYLQYHYIVANPFPSGETDQLVMAEGDDSGYGAVHEQHHEVVNWKRSNFGFSDLMLLNTNGDVVYTSMKQTDLGRNLISSVFVGDALGSAIVARLTGVALGETILIDFQRYAPAGGAPTMFAAAAVSSDQGAIGAVVVKVPIEALNGLTTSQEQWKDVGLGDTGETYVVGRDLLMRSDSRLWLEDQDAYLATLNDQDYPPETAESIDIFGTTVLQQPVNSEAVRVAFEGERHIGRTTNYLGQDTLTVADRVGSDDVDWVVVTEIGMAEASRPLDSYTRRLLITAVLLLLAVGILGVLLADRLARPFAPVVAAAARIARGDEDVEIPDFGRNELGDVARRLSGFAGYLRAQEESIAAEERETARLLLSALPPRLVERLRSGDEQLQDLADSATVVAITVTGIIEDPSIDTDTAVELAARVSRDLEEVADRLGLERVRSSSDQHLFVAGIGRPSTEPDSAAEFALAVGPLLDRFTDDTGVDVGFRIGMSSGDVISGLLASEQLTYGVFGRPPQTAVALGAIAGPGQILMHESIVGELDSKWQLEPTNNLLDLRGDDIQASLLIGSRQNGSDVNEATPEP